MTTTLRAAGMMFVTAVLLTLSFSPQVFSIQDQNNGQEVQGPDLDVMRGIDRAGQQGPEGTGFGDEVGVGFPAPGNFDRDASALFGEMFSEGAGKRTDADIARRRQGIDVVHSGEDTRRAVGATELNAQNQRVAAETEARIKAKEKADREALDRRREQARRSYELYERAAEKDGAITDEEQTELDRRWGVWMNAEQLTPAEEAEVNRYTQVRNQVSDDISQIASGLGGTNAEDRAERRQTFDMANAGTKTWRNATFTGQMVNQVAEDTFAQRERGIKAKNRYEAANIYLQQIGHTEEEIRIATEIRDTAYQTMGVAADAIAKNGGVVMLGTAADVGMLGLGRPVSWVSGKITGAVRGAITGGTEAGAAAAGSTAGTEAGVGAAAGRTAGTEAGTGGSTAANAAGRAGGEAAGDATQALSRADQQAVNQAVNDAKAQEAVSAGWRGGKELIDGGDSIVLGAEAAGGSTAAASSTTSEYFAKKAAELTIDEINALFKPGANLTGEQIGMKAELLAQGWRAPGAGAVLPAPPGLVPGAASEGATLVLPAGKAGAAGGSSAAAGGATLPPPGVAPPAGFASEAGTLVTRAGEAGAAGAGGTTQAGAGAMTLPPPGSSAAAGGTTKAFSGAVTLPPPSGATGAASNAATLTGESTTIIEKGGGAAFREAATVAE